MKTSLLTTACRSAAALGGFVAFLGVCAALGGVVSETPDGVVTGSGIIAVGTAVLVAAAVIGVLDRRSRLPRP